MADSSKSTELGEPVIGAKSKPGKGEKKKRKQGKKFGRAKFNETVGSKSQEQNVKENYEHSTSSLEEKTQTVAVQETSPEILGESKSQDGEKMPAQGQEQEETNKEDNVKKDAPQDRKSIQESSEEKTEAKTDLPTEQDGAESTKKSKRPHLSFLHPKKHSKTKVPSGVSKTVENTADKDESTEVEAKKATAKDDETSEHQEEVTDGAKIEPDAADIQNKEATKSPEGIQEKPPSKGNKGNKLKQFASFGRSKKKPDLTVKHVDKGLPDSETRDESLATSESSGLEESQNIESASTEVASIEKSGSTNEDIDAGDEKEETQDTAGKAKPFGSFLGLRRSKHAKKKKSLESEELEKRAEIVQSETSASKADDITVVEGVLVEEKTVEETETAEEKTVEEKTVEEKTVEEKTAEEKMVEIVDSQAEELTASAETDKEIGSSEKKAEQEATTDEEMSSTPIKKDRESRILRSFRKLKSPRSKSKKKAKENESDVTTNEDGATKTEVEPAESPEPKPRRGFGKAAKRKRSDLKNTGRIRAKKRHRDDESEEEEAFAKSQDQQESAEATEDTDDKELAKQKKKGGARGDTKDLQVRFTGDKVGRMGEADEETEDSEIGDASYESDITMVSEITVVSSFYEVRHEEPSQTGAKVVDTKKPDVPDSAPEDKTEPKVEEQPRVVEADEEIIITENEGDEKKEIKAGEKSSDPFANNPRAWILVRHLEMNEDITRQLGDMFMVNALKRSVTCCTIM